MKRAETSEKSWPDAITDASRAHHKPYIDKIIACQDEWELIELIEVSEV